MRSRHLVVLAFVPLAAGCWTSRSTRVEPRTLSARDSIPALTPIRAHLADGSVVVFRDGARVGDGMILGRAMQHGPLRQVSMIRERVPLDSVIAVESFSSNYNTGRTLMYSVVIPIVGLAFLIVAGGGFAF